MNQDIQIWRLKTRRRGLDQKLREELRRPRPDAFAVQKLKRLKLRLKDEIALAEAGVAGTA